MKKLILSLALLFMGASLFAQKLPKPKDIPESYRSEYKKAVEDYKQIEKRLKKEDWPIQLDPIESVPVMQYDNIASATGNWGEKLLLPNNLRSRLKSECKCQVFVKIADTGGKQSHSDLKQGQQVGANYTTSNTLDDIHGHGIHVAGISFADDFGMLDPLIDKGLVKWKPVKVLGDAGNGSFAWVANMIRAEDKQNKELISKGTSVVINGSFGGGTEKLASVETPLKASVDLGVYYVFAAGNTGRAVEFPGNSEYAITAASLDPNMNISSFSSRGPEIDHATPGREITSTWKNGQYATLSGTSMASPFLTSIVAIVKSRWCNKIEGVEEMKDYLAWISTDIGKEGKDDLSGWGIAYVQAILDKNPDDMDDKPNDPDDPVEEDPSQPITKKENTISVPLDENYSVFWKPLGAGKFEEMLINLKVRFTSKYYADYAIDLLKDETNQFFKNRAFIVLKNDDFVSASGWVGFFYDILLKKKGLDVEVVGITAMDKNKRIASPLKKGNSTLARLFGKKASTLVYPKK